MVEHFRDCSGCSRTLPDDFFQSKQGVCKDCRGVRDRVRKYNITVEEYDALVEKVGGFCQICHAPGGGRLHVDHCHDTGRVRGLLCSTCNRGIGLLRDDPSITARATFYLLST
jgi:hypothetical protein